MSTGIPPSRRAADALIGRDRDLEVVGDFLQVAATQGGALFLKGEPGVGKSQLLDAAAEIAADTGGVVLRAAGAEFEADISFSGLNQLLLPVVGEFERLAAPQRDTLAVALGFSSGRPPSRQEVGEATLALLRETSSQGPLLMIVDDVQWLDRTTALLLGPLVRDLAGSRIGFLAASRSDASSFFDIAGLPQHELPPLDDEAAASLLASRFPTLAPNVAERVLSEARGNPLALLELPAALSKPERAGRRALPAELPHSRRLEGLFSTRVGLLPEPSRRLLLLAALEGSGELKLLSAVAPDGRSTKDLLPALRAGLVTHDEAAGRLEFRHPLVRSTIVRGTTTTERRWAHAKLAEAFPGHDERHALHRAAAVVDPDEEVAVLLEEAADRIWRRGDAVGAVTTLLRAADLSVDPAARGRRLAQAAYLAADVTGDLRSLSQRLMDARRADPTSAQSLQTAIAASYLLLNGDGDIDTAHRLLVGALETQADQYAGDDPVLIDAVYNLLEVCLYGGRPELWGPFLAALDRLTLDESSVLSLWAKGLVDPVRTAAADIGKITSAVAALRTETDPTRIERIATAAIYIDRVVDAREPLWRVVRNARYGGAVTSAINALMAYDDFRTGRWEEGSR